MTAETETVKNLTKTFKFSFPTCSNEEVLFKLEVPVEIPHNGSTRELVQRVINMFHIPVYLEDEINENLAKFVSDETKNFHNERDEKLLNQLKNSEINVEGVVKNWEKLFKDHVMEFAEQKGTSDEEIFAAAYHKLVHSPALDTILSVENSYADTYMELTRNRDEDIKLLTARQTEEMEEKVRQLNITTTEEEINSLAGQHFEEQALVAGRWGSQLDALRQTQRTQFRAWLMDTLPQYQSTEPLYTPTNSPLATFSPRSALEPSPSLRPHLEESFTIHLGSQLKQTHNIRILTADMDYLGNQQPDTGWCGSRRLQTSLSLYSSELSAAVVAREWPVLCLAPAPHSSDHHFEPLDVQLRNIADMVKEPVEQRHARLVSEQSGGNAGGAGGGAGGSGGKHKRGLGAGDVLVTSHTNLPDVHVLFHLILDSHRTTEITSRHPAILGLRNILKAACCNDITHLSLPLLLTHELTEDMTLSWCSRRAELVLKCVKGFMLEGAGWGGAELRTLSVSLPAHTPPPLFSALAALLPAVFRISNPVYMRNQDD